MKTFELGIILEGTTIVEDHHCPSSWMGSHVYDIEVGATQKVFMVVIAETEEDAISVAEQHDYNADPNCQLEDVHDVTIEDVDSWEYEEGDESDISYRDVEIKIDDREPLDD